MGWRVPWIWVFVWDLYPTGSPVPLHKAALVCRYAPTHPGKYSASGAKPSGPRALVYGERRLTEVAPVIEAVRAIATERGKSMAQVRAAVRLCGCVWPNRLTVRCV